MTELRRALRLGYPLAAEGAVQLQARWREHALTLVGIVWGATAVVLLLSLGAGFYRSLDLGFKKTGDRYVMVDGQYTSVEMGGARPGRPIVLDRDDLARIRASAPSARFVAAECERGSVTGRTPARTRTTLVSATTEELQHIQVHRVARGRFLDDEDDRLERSVVVLGANLAEIFFPGLEPLGRTLQLDGHPFRVIGLLARKGPQFVINNGLHDDTAYIPLSRGQRLFGLGHEVGTIQVEPWRVDETELLVSELRAVLWPAHHLAREDLDAIRIHPMREFIEPMLRIGAGLELLLGFIGTIILAMAGAGVANLMVAIVSQRRPELAMRRACGARRADVMLQLLVETLVVVLAGGAVGVGLGAAFVAALGWVPMPEMIPAPRLEASVLVTTFAVLVGVGLGAGLTPARTASRIDPAAALRVV